MVGRFRPSTSSACAWGNPSSSEGFAPACSLEPWPPSPRPAGLLAVSSGLAPRRARRPLASAGGVPCDTGEPATRRHRLLSGGAGTLVRGVDRWPLSEGWHVRRGRRPRGACRFLPGVGEVHKVAAGVPSQWLAASMVASSSAFSRLVSLLRVFIPGWWHRPGLRLFSPCGRRDDVRAGGVGCLADPFLVCRSSLRVFPGATSFRGT